MTQGEIEALAVEHVSKWCADRGTSLIRLHHYSPKGDFVTARGTSLEIKGCAVIATTGNLVFETISNHLSGRPGWARTLEDSVTLFYVDVVTPTMYTCKMKDLRKHVEPRLDTYRETFTEKGNPYKTIFRLVPIKELLRHGVVTERPL